jgi:hypothetical protein
MLRNPQSNFYACKDRTLYTVQCTDLAFGTSATQVLSTCGLINNTHTKRHDSHLNILGHEKYSTSWVISTRLSTFGPVNGLRDPSSLHCNEQTTTNEGSLQNRIKRKQFTVESLIYKLLSE